MCKTVRIFCIVTAVVACGLLNLPTRAQPGVDTILASIRSQQVADAFEDKRFHNIEIGWSHETLVDASPAHIAALERAVTGRPDHPARAELELARNVATHGPAIVTRRLFLIDVEHWRIGLDNPRWDATPFVDEAANGPNGWRYAACQLSLVTRAAPNPGVDPWSLRASHEYVIAMFCGGALGAPSLDATRPPRVSDAWFELYIVPRTGQVVRVEGEWDSRNQRAVLRTATNVLDTLSSPSLEGWSWTFDGLVDRPLVGRAMYTEIRQRDPQRHDAAIWKLVSVSKIDQPITPLLATPMPGKTDPIRGEVRPAQVADYTVAPPRFTNDMPSAVAAIAGIEARPARRSWIGIVAATIAATAVLIVIRAKRASGVHPNVLKGE